MDLSKLPGKTPAADPSAIQPPPPKPVLPLDNPSPPAGRQPSGPPAMDSASAFFHVGIGLVFLYFASRLLAFLAAKLTGGTFNYTFTDSNNAPIPYTQSWFFIGDLPIALTGLAMIAEALVLLFAPKRGPLAGLAALGAITLVINIGAFVYLLPRSGPQLLLLLGILVSGYILISTVTTLRREA